MSGSASSSNRHDTRGHGAGERRMELRRQKADLERAKASEKSQREAQDGQICSKCVTVDENSPCKRARSGRAAARGPCGGSEV